MESILNEKHVFNILQFLAAKGTVKRNEMLEIVPSNAYLDKILPKLQKVGYITVETKTMGRKIILISPTSKGRIVAENLEHLEEPRISGVQTK